jgi:hypothetical protein
MMRLKHRDHPLYGLGRAVRRRVGQQGLRLRL